MKVGELESPISMFWFLPCQVIATVHIFKPSWRPSSNFLLAVHNLFRFLRNLHQYVVVILQEI